MRPRLSLFHRRPIVECLEDRRLLACEVFVRDRTLFIVGDKRDNRIAIVASELGVQVKCDGNSSTFTDIGAIDVQAGAGNDRIHFRGQFVSPDIDLALNIAPGSGQDEVLVAFEHGFIARPLVIGALWNKETPLHLRPATASPTGALSLVVSTREQEIHANFSLVGGFGRDEVRYDEFVGMRGEKITSNVNIATGLGNDDVKVNVESAAEDVVQKVRVDSGEGNDRVVVNVPEAHRDAFDDVIVGTDAGDNSQVRVFDGNTNAESASFSAFPGFSGGVRVAAGDINGDGVADIITGAGPGAGGGPVKVFDGRTHALLKSFLAFPGFSGGVFVAAGDVNGDGHDDIIVGADAGASGGHVKVFDGQNLSLLRSFLRFQPSAAGCAWRQATSTAMGWPTSSRAQVPAAPAGQSKSSTVRTSASSRVFSHFPASAAAFSLPRGTSVERAKPTSLPVPMPGPLLGSSRSLTAKRSTRSVPPSASTPPVVSAWDRASTMTESQ